MKASAGTVDRIPATTAAPWRLRAHLWVFAFALALPLLALAAYALREMARLQEAETERLVLVTAERLAADLDRELDQASVVLETLAASEVLRRGDFAGFHRHALSALRHTKSAIVVVDHTFQQLADTLRDFGAPLPKTADEETARRVFETGQRQISNLFRGSVSGRPVFNVEVPVFSNEERVRYVLIMSFQAAHVADLLRGARLPAGWTAGVADRRGVVLARSEDHETYVGRQLTDELLEHNRSLGLLRTRDLSGQPILRATVRSGISGWTVSVRVPADVLAGPTVRSKTFAAVLLAAALLLGSALAVIFGALLARPIEQATRAAVAVGQGVIPAPPACGSVHEANVLMLALHDAAVGLRSREEHTGFLIRELAHRAKNQLAAIQGIAIQTARQATSLDDFVRGFTNRLRSLALSHDLLVRQDWRGAWLHHLVAAQLELFGARDRAAIEGPPVFVDDRAVQNIGYALHELVTNAVKYGALSDRQGTITIRWQMAESGLQFVWTERGRPLAPATSRTGFGYRVLTSHVPLALQGAACLRLEACGLRWELTLPHQHVRTGDEEGRGPHDEA